MFFTLFIPCMYVFLYFNYPIFGVPSSWHLCPFAMTLFIFDRFLAYDHTNMFQDHLKISCLDLEIAIFFKKPRFKEIFEKKAFLLWEALKEQYKIECSHVK